VYNETIRDLIAIPGSSDKASKAGLEVRREKPIELGGLSPALGTENATTGSPHAAARFILTTSI
jgi:hypothetical protein